MPRQSCLLDLLTLPTRKIHYFWNAARCSHNHPHDLFIALVDLLVLTIRRDQGPVSCFQDLFLLVSAVIQRSYDAYSGDGVNNALIFFVPMSVYVPMLICRSRGTKGGWVVHVALQG